MIGTIVFVIIVIWAVCSAFPRAVDRFDAKDRGDEPRKGGKGRIHQRTRPRSVREERIREVTMIGSTKPLTKEDYKDLDEWFKSGNNPKDYE
jgi:hypothetical protein